MIYTSGSTGKPKGVAVPHRAICNHMQWVRSEFGLGESDRVLHYTSIGFDASLLELFAPLCAGATVVLAGPQDHHDLPALTRLVREAGVTLLQSVPSALRAFLAEPSFRGCDSLRLVICGGEALPWDLAREFRNLHRATLHNCYGPTEATIDAASTRVEVAATDTVAAATVTGTVPIGRPIANAQCYVLDADMQPVPIGVPGELL